METGIGVGTLLEHPEFGRGKVLGLSEKRESIRVRFEKCGIKELPRSCKGLEPAPEDPGGIDVESLRMRFAKGSDRGRGCRWFLEFPKVPLVSLVQGIDTWAHRKVKVEGASIQLCTLGAGAMQLDIEGQGRDGRCRWCRTFRSGLKTAVRRGFGSRAFVLDGNCRFDEIGGNTL